MKYFYTTPNDDLEESKYYVYIWFDYDVEKDVIGMPFYVGKGCGNRYMTISNRSKKFKEYVSSHDVASIIVIKNLEENIAYFCEQRIKEKLYKNGITLIDGEFDKNQHKQSVEEGIAAMPVVNGKKISAKTGRGFGRPKCNVDQRLFNELNAMQKSGAKTVTECCSQLGIGRTTWYELVKGITQ